MVNLSKRKMKNIEDNDEENVKTRCSGGVVVAKA